MTQRADELIDCAIDLFQTKGWCKEVYARDAAGQKVDPLSDKACSFCMLGAFLKCSATRVSDFEDNLGTFEGDAEIWSRIWAVNFKAKIEGIPAFNDDDATTKEMVLDTLRKARSLPEDVVR